MSIHKFLNILAIVVIFTGVAQATQPLTLILLGNDSDSNSIRITKDFSTHENNINFQICNTEGTCKSIGTRPTYHECQIKELVRIPLWAVLLDGGDAFTKAAGSWAGFSKILVDVDNYEFVQKQLTQKNPIRVTNYLFKKQAEKVTVLIEAEKIQQALTKVDNFNCK